MGGIHQVLMMIGGRLEVVYMDFEGTPGSSTFTDEGTAHSVWTKGGNADIANITVLAGSTSLDVSGIHDSYVETALTSGNGLPATGDWDLKVLVRSSVWTLGGTGRTFLSAQDATFTAAGTQFACASSSTSKLVFVLSNGTTRSVICTSTNNIPVNATVTLEWQRRTNTINQYINGGLDGTGSFSGSICQPAGRKIRIGKPEATVASGWQVFFDNLRIRRY